MSVLNRKLWRDLVGSAGVLLTVVAIIAVGTGSFIGLRCAQRILETSQRVYYDDYRFADFWVGVKKAPLSAVERVAALEGIAQLHARVVFDVILDLPTVVKPLKGRLISTPAQGFDKCINGICLVRGSGFSDDRAEEIILSEAFARKHHLEPGDRISLILNRKRESFVIVGTAISPEYVYMVRGEGDFAPDPEHFGILYVKQRYAREVLDFQDACNQIAGELVAGYTGDVDLLLDKIEQMLDPYGVLATTPRARQASHRFLSDEIKGLGTTAAILPSIFLVVAAMVLNILTKRLAEQQRSIIGTLKALGYSDRQVLAHFLSFGLVVGVVGGLAGMGVGTLMAMGMIELYRTFYQFPDFLFRSYPDLLLVGLSVSVLFSAGGTAKGVWNVLRLQPAEAMRPRPPQRGGAIFLERLGFVWTRLGFRTHIALRSLVRNWGRTLSGITASMLSTAIVFMTLVMYDSVDFLLDYQFDYVAHSDADIGMRNEKSARALLEARALPGVDYGEGLLGLVCHLRRGWRSRRVTVTGLPRDHHLTTPLDRNQRPIEIPEQGLVLSSKLAEILGARTGDRLELMPVRGRRRSTSVHVASIVESYLGLDCYASQRFLSRVVGETEAVNAVQLAVNPARTEELYRSIKKLPNAQGLSVRSDVRRNIENTFAESISVTLGITVLFAGVIAFGSMLNASMIEMGDRLREISTFRVLGYSNAQVSAILLRQNLIIYFLGLALALPFGYWMSLLAAEAYATELFRMPIVVRPVAVVWTAVTTFAFVMTAQGFVYRHVGRIDWLEGMKVKE